MNNHLEIFKKIEFLIRSFVESGAKIWNIDTSIYTTWERFHNNIKELKNVIEMPNFTIQKTLQDRYIIKHNNIIITPISRGNDWSKSGTRQFLQEGIALGFFNIDVVKIFKQLSTYGVSNIVCARKILKFISQEDYMKKLFVKDIVYTIQYLGDSPISFVNNFGFSIFLCLIFSQNIYNNYESNIELKRIMKKSNEVFSSDEVFNSITFNSSVYLEYISKCNKETYKKIIELLNINYNFEFLINDLYNSLTNSVDRNEMYIENIEEARVIDLYKDELDGLINIERSKIRDQIIESRKLDIVTNKCNELLNTEPPSFDLRDCEACHLYDVWSIKENIYAIISDKKYQTIAEIKMDKAINELMQMLSDPNNGIMMHNSWHYYFDRNFFNFDISGKLIINYAIDKNVLSRLKQITLGYVNNSHEIKINPLVFNEKMKSYLLLRKPRN